MIYFSDELVLSRIQAQHAYYDVKSEEISTGIVKPKYKLAGNVLLEVYTFFVLTSNEQTCQKLLTLKIAEDDWEQREPRFLEGCGFLDIKKVEVLNKDDILTKSRDSRNGFRQVAKLCDKKFEELKKLKHKIHYSPRPIPETTKNLIFNALEEINSADTIMKKLNLD